MTAREWIDAARASGMRVHLSFSIVRPVADGEADPVQGDPDKWPGLLEDVGTIAPSELLDELLREAART